MAAGCGGGQRRPAARAARAGKAEAENSDPFGILGGYGAGGDPLGGYAALLGESVDDADGDVCRACGGSLRPGTDGLERVCDGCGLVVEGDSAQPEEDDAPRAPAAAPRLQVVGPGSGQLQPDLYRSGEGTTAAEQRKQVYEEYKAYRQLYVEAGGRAFPLDACERAADHYNRVQHVCVKRSQNKKRIMAACFYQACLELGFAPTKIEVAAFMQLPNKGIAGGTNFIRAFAADGKMDGVDVNIDPCYPEINTLFAAVGLEGDRYRPLADAVHEIVETATREHIGASSILRSKVAGAAFTVFRRCRDKSLVPKAPSLNEFCQSYRIRKNTISSIISQLDAYHSFFEPIYRRRGLDPR